MTVDKNSGHSIMAASISREKFSDHANSLGAAGYISPYDDEQEAEFLSQPGETAIVNPGKDGIANFEVGVAWDNVKPTGEKVGFLDKLLGRVKVSSHKGVDLDIGCLYEMQNGQRGGVQAFGDQFGALDQPPYIHLSNDERTGDKHGEDEVISINGQHWPEFKRVLIYIYIYDGAQNWATVKPQIQVRVPGEMPMVVTLNAKKTELMVCAVAGLENIRGGIKMTNYLEYFPGHASMDRAFGFGLEWEDGQKD